MLLAVDIGNSHTVLGIFQNGKILQSLRFETDKMEEKDYYKSILSQKLEKIQKEQIHDIAISSVVPELDETYRNLSQDVFRVHPLFISTRLKTNIANLSEKETALGADRLCDIVAATDISTGNRIVVDMGTATKFEVISGDDEYLGGAIAPGVGTSFESLLTHASKLNNLTLGTPQKVVGRWRTKEHLDSGYVFGFASLIDGMIEKIKKELGWNHCTIFVTGGFTDLISPSINHEITINKHLTLEGIHLLWKLNNEPLLP